MMVLSFLLIGADLVGAYIGGLNFRLVSLTLVAATLFQWLQKRQSIRMDLPFFLLFSWLICAAIISLSGTYDLVRSLAFIAWMVFTLIFVVQAFYNFCLQTTIETALRIWFIVFRIHAVATILQYVAYQLGYDFFTWAGRPRLWFHETSLLAYFLAGYFGAALFLMTNFKRRYWRDAALAFVALVTTYSVSGMIGVLFSVGLVTALSRRRLYFLAGIVVSLLLCVAGFLAFQSSITNSLGYGFLLGWIENVQEPGDFFWALAMRGGFRAGNVLFAWEAFKENMLTGIGAGAERTYMEIVPVPYSVITVIPPGFLNRGEDFQNAMLFGNIFVEAMGTMGIIGLIPMIGVVGYFVLSYASIKGGGAREIQARAFYIGAFVMLLLLQFDGVFLRFVFWATVGLALGAREVLRRARTVV
jgi:O-antigen ligase